MSCYVVSDLTISAIVAAMADTDFEPASLKDEKSGVKYNPATCGQIVGQMLLDANYVSVNEYYGKHTRAHEFKLTQKQDGKPFTLGEKYGCIECYEYQACQQLDTIIRRSATHSITQRTTWPARCLKSSVRSLSGVLNSFISHKRRSRDRLFLNDFPSGSCLLANIQLYYI